MRSDSLSWQFAGCCEQGSLLSIDQKLKKLKKGSDAFIPSKKNSVICYFMLSELVSHAGILLFYSIINITCILVIFLIQVCVSQSFINVNVSLCTKVECIYRDFQNTLQFLWFVFWFLSNFSVFLLCLLTGEVVLVAQRLDARYDWLPSPHHLIHKHTRFNITFYGNACNFQSDWQENKIDDKNGGDKLRKKHKKKISEGRIALVSPGGCSLSTKVSSRL